ncbi:MAG: hypothetical protein ACPGYV_13045 [Phycisphaeraceae bacterium]
MLVGRLTGSVDGRPIEINAEGGRVVVMLSSVGSAWRLRRTWPAVKRLFDSVAPFYGVAIFVSAPKLPTMELSPRRSWWVNLFLPG